MKEEPHEEIYNFIYSIEDWVWKTLRDDGHSDSQIWDWVLNSEYEKPTPGLEKQHYCALLIYEINLFYERIEDDNFSQSAVDWAREGWLIATLRTLAGIDDYDTKAFSKIQSERAKKPRSRVTFARRAISHVLSTAWVEDSRGKADTFRKAVGYETVIALDGNPVEITARENDDGKIVEYHFHEVDTDREPETIKNDSLRKIVRNM